MQIAPAAADRPPIRYLEVHHLPAFPAVALELMDLLDRPECSVHDVTAILRREPTLAAEVLKVSNSALYFRHKEEILDLDTALVVIGLAEARRVALNAAIRGMIGSALGVPELRLCWSHCIAVALISETLSARFGQHGGRAYVAGLLHDLGMLAILSLYPAEYREMLLLLKRDGTDWRAAERDTFGRDHEQVGAALAKQMGLPTALWPILSHHHDCPDCSQPTMMSLVAMSDRIAALLGYQVGERSPYSSLDDLFSQTPPPGPMPDAEEFERLRARIEASVI